MNLPDVSSMPTPVKAAGIVVGGGGVLAALGVVFPKILVGLVIGAAVVALLLVLYKFILKLLDKRKANPFAKSIAQSSAAPSSISDAGKRARLDDMRRTFEGGLEKFKAAGKDLYSVPWYMLVGEPGSGKTEAIRHCNVGFPPGLQDQLQGAGGTLNMNWWFTNHAIILDTAGRLLFEEAPPGQTTEWQEFLKLLLKARPNCPINGMLLVIPADSLVRDRADAIEKKAGKIAQQLDNIQRALSVRFPVFVIVTKCDLVNGFREYFDTLEDPQLQHQIFGWTNPTELDQAFRPEQVEQHLSTVRERIVRRRAAMLQDPVHTESASGRRIDQVDALYSFPDSLGAIGPRLKRYLEMIFVAGEWSSKPLFLRGIYFTSSMREGSALDSDLAEALGVSIESLPEGKVWERERAYFLRDLFVGKVFKERGLVTRAGNVRQAQQRRRATVLGAGIATVLVLLGLTIWAGLTFSKSIDAQREYWSGVASQAKLGSGEFDLVRETRKNSKEYRYSGTDPLSKVGADQKVDQFLTALPEKVSKPVGVPTVFKPMASLSGDLDLARRDAARAIAEAGVVRAGVRAAMAKLADEGVKDPWRPEATAALAQMIRLDSLAAGIVPAGGQMIDAEAVYRYVLGDGYADKAGAIRDIQKACDNLLGADGWKSGAAGIMTAADRETLAATVKRFVAQRGTPGAGGTLANLQELQTGVKAFRDAEDKLLEVARPYFDGKTEPLTMAEYDQRRTAWDHEYPPLADAGGAVGKALAKLAPELARTPAIGALCDAASKDAVDRAHADFEMLLVQTRPKDAAPAAPTTQASALAPVISDALTRLDTSLKATAESVKADLTSADKDFLAPVAGSDPPRRMWDLRAAMYAAADERLKAAAKVGTPEGGALPAFGELTPTAKAMAAEDDAASKRIGDAAKAGGTLPRNADAEKASRIVMKLASRRAAYVWAGNVLDHAPASPADMNARLADLLKRHTEVTPLPRPNVPLTAMSGGEFSAQYQPAVAALVFGEWKFVAESMAAQNPRALEGPALLQRADAARKSYEQFARDYVEYWGRTVPEKEAAIALVPWTDFHARVRAMKAFDVISEERRLLVAVDEALKAVPPEMAEASGLKGTRERLASEIAQLDREDAKKQFDATRKSIADLGDDPALARQAVLALKRDDLDHGLLETYLGKDKGVRYLNDLVLAALKILADASQKDARTALSGLGSAAVFPLCRDCPEAPAMPRALMAMARDQAGRIGVSASPPSGNKNSPTTTVAQGARTGTFPEIDQQLDTLAGEDLFKGNTKTREWAGKLLAVTEFLREPAQNCTLEILKTDDQTALTDTEQATVPFVYVEFVASEGDRVLVQTRLPKAGAFKCKLPGPKVTLRFQIEEHGQSQAEVSLPADWNVVKLVLAGGARLDTDEKGPILKAPLVFADAAGQKYSYWIGVRFERPPPWPPAEKWPAKSEWPGAQP